MEKGIIDSFDLDPAMACRDADLVLFATPVGTFLDIAANIHDALKPGAIVTDVGSIKGILVRELEAQLPDSVAFLGCHPIAGSDRSGIDSAVPNLFMNAKCIITPTEKTNDIARDKVVSLWKTFGSVIEVMSPEEHDRVYALVSHFPHLIAYAIMNVAADINSSYLKFAGQGFLDTTRIAASSPELWRDICIMNRDNLLACIEVFRENLEGFSRYLRACDSESLEKEFERARTLRKGIGQHCTQKSKTV
jgi:prephenate dehydrogenase